MKIRFRIRIKIRWIIIRIHFIRGINLFIVLEEGLMRIQELSYVKDIIFRIINGKKLQN
jgi:hypothetical protein